MDLNKKLEELKPYQLNCNVFDVYSYNGLSMQDLLCQFFTKINECITVSNETIDLAKWLVNEGLEIEVVKKLMIWLEDGTLENIINVNLFNTLNDKINGLSSQLEHNTNNISDLSLQKNNSKGYLELPVYNSDSNQATHPSVLFFENKWNGYYYWMAMTPYEKEDENLENPSILASNDGIIWEVPQGLTNPIDKTLNVGDYHFSDTHLVYANGQLECWYRKRTRGTLPTNEIILRKKSTDGINWGEAEVLYETNVQRADLLLSPTVIFEDGKYKIWVSNFRDGVIDYFESNTGGNWVKIRSIEKPKHYKNYKVWHMDIKHTSNGYEMYYCAGLDYKCYEICYSKSDDNINYSDAITVITPSKIGFDENRLYRPCFVDSWLGKRYIYYGAINTSNDWRIGLSISDVKKPTLLDGAILSNNTEYFGGNNFNIPNKLQVFKDILVGKYAYIKENVIKLVKPGVGGVNLKVSETKANTLQVLSDSGLGLGHIEANSIMVTDIIGDTVLVKSTNSDTNAKLKIVKPNVGGTTIKQVIDGLLEFRTDNDNDYTDIMIKRLFLKDNSNGNTYRVQCENGLFKYHDGKYLQTVSLVYSGYSKDRPSNATRGTQYFDVELGKPIWHKGDNVWVDSNGTTV